MLDASYYRPFGLAVPPEQGALWCPLAFWSPDAPTGFDPSVGVAKAPALPVIANQNRWIVNCPDCDGAQLACRTDPRLMCTYCANSSVRFLWRRIAWPRHADRIEQLLHLRPERHRNWVPGETLGRLRDENRQHGLVNA